VLKVKCHLLQQHLQVHPLTRVPLMSQLPLLETLNSPVGLRLLVITWTKTFNPATKDRTGRQNQCITFMHMLRKNCVDISALSDAMPAAILFADVMLPDQSDVDKRLSDFETLTSRLVLLCFLIVTIYRAFNF